MASPPKEISPLAEKFLSSGAINPQSACPLFSKLPPEIRVNIYAFTLTAYEDFSRPYSAHRTYWRPGNRAVRRVAHEVLVTCRVIYVEAHLVALTINPLEAVHGFARDVPPFLRSPQKAALAMESWQYNAVRSLDLTVQQFHLDNFVLAAYGNLFNTAYRPPRRTRTVRQSICNGVPQQWKRKPAFSFMTRLEKLRVRLPRHMWWTWASHPSLPYGLALDPYVKGGGNGLLRCTAERMQQEAAFRLQGIRKEPEEGSWALHIGLFEDLKILEFEFETFKAKEHQLEQVVDCAKTWTFPMKQGYELKHDGNVEAWSWSGHGPYGYESQARWLPAPAPRSGKTTCRRPLTPRERRTQAAPTRRSARLRARHGQTAAVDQDIIMSEPTEGATTTATPPVPARRVQTAELDQNLIISELSDGESIYAPWPIRPAFRQEFVVRVMRWTLQRSVST